MTATSLKQDGDDLYKQGKFKEAIDKYTMAIDKCTNPSASDIHLAYSNRSACYMQQTAFEKALEDANVCVALKPIWPKAYSRKGACLAALNRTQEAITCYERVLQLDRSNIEATNALAKLSQGQRHAARTSTSPRSADNNSQPNAPSYASQLYNNLTNLDYRKMYTSIMDYLTFYYYRCLTWWSELSPQTKLYIQGGVAVLFLYLLFFRPSFGSSYDSGYGYGTGYSSGYGSSYGSGYGGGYGAYGGGYGGYGGYGGGMSWMTLGLIMAAAWKIPPMLPDQLGEYARPFFGMNWTTFMWLLNMFSRNTGRMGGMGGYGMPGGMFGQRRRW